MRSRPPLGHSISRLAVVAEPRPKCSLRSLADRYDDAFLMETHQEPEALRFLDKAASLLPANREILLARAAFLQLVLRVDDAERLFSEIQNRWPEWYPVWAAHGIALRTNNQKDDAGRALDTAKALRAPPDLLNLDLRSFLERVLFRQ